MKTKTIALAICLIIGVAFLRCIQKGELPRAKALKQASLDIHIDSVQPGLDNTITGMDTTGLSWERRDSIELDNGARVVFWQGKSALPDLDSMIENPWVVETTYLFYSRELGGDIVESRMVIDTNVIGTISNLQEILRRLRDNK